MKKILHKIIRKTIGNRVTFGEYTIKLGRNHNLPSVLEKYQEYGSNLTRLARVVYNKYRPLKIFDVGANVGDTVAMLLSDNRRYEILCVEGDEKYSRILLDNFGNNNSVHVYKNFLGRKNEIIRSSTLRKEGTLKINNNIAEQKPIKITTLDSLIENNQQCFGAKLLKIDTDGYDNSVLWGAFSYLSTTKPVIFFEYDTTLLKANKENRLDIFGTLREIGYKKLVFFDNYGRFLISVDIENIGVIKQLDRYIDNSKGAFPYYDIAVFHDIDNDIADYFVKNEEQRT